MDEPITDPLTHLSNLIPDAARLRNAIVALVILDGLLVGRGWVLRSRPDEGIAMHDAAREVYARAMSRYLGLSRDQVEVALDMLAQGGVVEPRLPILPGFCPRSTPVLPASYGQVAAHILLPFAPASAAQNRRRAAGRALALVAAAGERGLPLSASGMEKEAGMTRKALLCAARDIVDSGAVTADADGTCRLAKAA